ncbi:helix-turn-helix transcriptional regulator [Phormidesmis priestleyi]|nr:helix-turn-helix transcriptional regulator [Phormidesmis priestleyi]
MNPSISTPMTFGDWLHFQRRKKSIRQEDLAKALVVSPQTVSAWETGRNVPRFTPQQMQVLCEMLNCPLSEIAQAFTQAQMLGDSENSALPNVG